MVLYGKVMVGHVTVAGDEKRGLEEESELDKELLEPFFELDAEEMPKAAPIKLDEPAKPGEPLKPAEPAMVPTPKAKP